MCMWLTSLMWQTFNPWLTSDVTVHQRLWPHCFSVWPCCCLAVTAGFMSVVLRRWVDDVHGCLCSLVTFLSTFPGWLALRNCQFYTCCAERLSWRCAWVLVGVLATCGYLFVINCQFYVCCAETLSWWFAWCVCTNVLLYNFAVWSIAWRFFFYFNNSLMFCAFFVWVLWTVQKAPVTGNDLQWYITLTFCLLFLFFFFNKESNFHYLSINILSLQSQKWSYISSHEAKEWLLGQVTLTQMSLLAWCILPVCVSFPVSLPSAYTLSAVTQVIILSLFGPLQRECTAEAPPQRQHSAAFVKENSFKL